jgi:hypothetical protein
VRPLKHRLPLGVVEQPPTDKQPQHGTKTAIGDDEVQVWMPIGE